MLVTIFNLWLIAFVVSVFGLVLLVRWFGVPVRNDYDDY